MIQQIIFIFFGIVFFPRLMTAETLTVKHPGSIGALIHQAEQSVRRGKYEEAQEKYELALKEIRHYNQHLMNVRTAYDNAKIAWLFSKSIMPGSKIHKVQEDDSLMEIAKKYRTTVELLRRSNHLKKDAIRKGMKLKVVTGKFSVLVDKSKNILELKLDKKTLKHYRVATGKDNKTPVGRFKIINRVQDPTWYKEKGVVIPPGKSENHLGPRWLGFDKPSYGIHGTVEPKTIGTQASAGCVRMLNRDVEEIFDIVPIGTEVIIQD